MSAEWDFSRLGAVNAFPRRVRDGGIPRRLYRERKWRLRGRLMRFMVTAAYRQMNAHYRDHGDAAAALDVVGVWELLETAGAADRHGIIDDAPPELFGFPEWVHLTTEDAEHAARVALKAARAHWRPQFMDTCILGGQVSKRGATFTMDAYLQVQHMVQSKAAEALGCSIATIKRLRAAAAAHGGAIRAAALEYARRQRKPLEDVLRWYQIAKTWAVPGSPEPTHPGTNGGEPPP